MYELCISDKYVTKLLVGLFNCRGIIIKEISLFTKMFQNLAIYWQLKMDYDDSKGNVSLKSTVSDVSDLLIHTSTSSECFIVTHLSTSLTHDQHLGFKVQDLEIGNASSMHMHMEYFIGVLHRYTGEYFIDTCLAFRDRECFIDTHVHRVLHQSASSLHR